MRTEAYEKLLVERLREETKNVDDKTRKSAAWKTLEAREKRIREDLEIVQAMQAKMLCQLSWQQEEKLCAQLRAEIDLAREVPGSRRREEVKAVLRKKGIVTEGEAKASPSRYRGDAM